MTHLEVDLDLDRALTFGALPAIYLDDSKPQRTLVELYLKEEVFQEALVRNIEGFIRFIDLAGQMNAETMNFAKLARESNGKVPFWGLLYVNGEELAVVTERSRSVGLR